MKFNLWRCLGIVATWAAAFLLLAMLYSDPAAYFFRRLARDNRDLVLVFIVAVSFAAVFLSIEKEKE
jgi:hypothetical protein